MASRQLSEIAKTIRSKNAGVDKITFDVIFPGRGTYARVREMASCLAKPSAESSASLRRKFRTTQSSTRPWRSSSQFTAGRRAAAPVTPTSSATSNMARCWISKYRKVGAPRGASFEVGCGGLPSLAGTRADGEVAPKAVALAVQTSKFRSWRKPTFRLAQQGDAPALGVQPNRVSSTVPIGLTAAR
jgi:hypothetical protein